MLTQFWSHRANKLRKLAVSHLVPGLLAVVPHDKEWFRKYDLPSYLYRPNSVHQPALQYIHAVLATVTPC